MVKPGQAQSCGFEGSQRSPSTTTREMQEALAALPHPRGTRSLYMMLQLRSQTLPQYLSLDLQPHLDSFLQNFQRNSYANCSSITCKLILDDSCECPRTSAKQKSKWTDSAKSRPFGSTRYRHSLSPGKTCSIPRYR